ncbi:MAG: hypothetical protein R3C69_17145, partial [Geminicoccaceae bacterium]
MIGQAASCGRFLPAASEIGIGNAEFVVKPSRHGVAGDGAVVADRRLPQLPTEEPCAASSTTISCAGSPAT